MGQKTHPRGLRLGILDTWDSRWFSNREYAQWLTEDINIRKFIKERLTRAGIAKIEIERIAGRTTVTIYSARPGVVIGRQGSESEAHGGDPATKTPCQQPDSKAESGAAHVRHVEIRGIPRRKAHTVSAKEHEPRNDCRHRRDHEHHDNAPREGKDVVRDDCVDGTTSAEAQLVLRVGEMLGGNVRPCHLCDTGRGPGAEEEAQEADAPQDRDKLLAAQEEAAQVDAHVDGVIVRKDASDERVQSPVCQDASRRDGEVLALGCMHHASWSVWMGLLQREGVEAPGRRGLTDGHTSVATMKRRNEVSCQQK